MLEGNNLLIGLGGTGYDILMKIREKLLVQYGEYQRSEVEFCYIDTDNDKFTEPYIIEVLGRKENIQFADNEFIYIRQDGMDMKKFIETHPSVHEYCNEYGKEYKNYIGSAFPKNGAGQKRMVGKLFLTFKQKDVLDALRQKIENLNAIAEQRANTNNKSNEDDEYNVFIFGSLAGGTGSGTCIDIPFFLQKAAEGIVDSGKLNIWGFFADNSFYKGLAHTQFVEPNTYGALSELEYWKNNINSVRFTPYGFSSNNLPQKYYDRVYIMQKHIQGATITYSDMEDACSSAIIALINKSILSEFSNNAQEDLTMENKKRLLASFGVSNIKISRPKIKKYIVNKMLQNQLLYFNADYNDRDISERANKFIVDYELDEGIGEDARDINQLIERLCPLYESIDDDLKSIAFRNIDTGKEADVDIEKAKTVYMNNINVKVNEIIQDNNNVSAVIERLHTIKGDLFKQKGGVSAVRKFFRSLENQFLQMRNILAQEVEEHKESKNNIEQDLNRIKAELPNQTKLFGRIDHDGQKTLIARFNKKCTHLEDDDYKSLAKELIEIKRKTAAIEYYNVLLDDIRNVYTIEDSIRKGEIARIEQEVADIIDVLDMNLRQVESYTAKDVKFDVYVDGDIISNLKAEIEDNNINPNNVIIGINEISQYISESNSQNDLIENLRNHIDDKLENTRSIDDDGTLKWAIYNKKNYPLERILTKYITDKQRKDIFNTVKVNNRFLWQYKDMNMPTLDGNDYLPEKSLRIFRKDITQLIEKNLLSKEDYIFGQGNNTYKHLLNMFAGDTTTYVDNNNPDVITFYMQEDAIPMFKLGTADNMATVFNRTVNDVNRNYYTDNRIYADRKNVIHPVEDIDFMQDWLFANILKIIQRDRTGYFIQHPIKGKEYLVKGAKGKTNRKLAFDEFSQEKSYRDFVAKQMHQALEKNKEELQTKIIDYLSTMYDRSNLKISIDRLSDEEKTLLQEEQSKLVLMAVDDFDITPDKLVNERLDISSIDYILDHSK